MNERKSLELLQPIQKQLKYYNTLETLMDLDQWSSLPKHGAGYRQQVAAFVAGQKADLMASKDVKTVVQYFSSCSVEEIQDDVERGLVRNFLHQYQCIARVPKEKLQQMSSLKAVTTGKWVEAKEKSDYAMFKPYLEEVFKLKKEIVGYIAPEKKPFEALIGITDQGLTLQQVSTELGKLKDGIKDLLKRINSSSTKIEDSFVHEEFDPRVMDELGRELIFAVGYDLDKGGFAHVPHAFSSFMGPKDARISTNPSGQLDLLFTYLHEAGHAMYAYGGSEKVNEMNLFGGIEGGFHEAQARFYENIIGRSREYWMHTYPKLQQRFRAFQSISLDDFYRGINKVEPNPIRIISDEVTYSLHPIIRFELERDLFDGSLDFDDLPKAWNDKYENYLGIRPANDAEGVLQDMHWAGDYIGYFQSYALGNVYDGQIREAILREDPDFYGKIRRGEFSAVSEWFEKNIYCHGSCLTAGELMKKVSGETMNADGFLRYLNEKYLEIYHWNS